MKKELVWMLGCSGLAVALVEMTIGLRNTSIQEVQLHDTYFVFNPFNILIPVLAMVLALVYLIRCILNGFSQVATNLILIGSTVIICLIGIAGIIGINQSAQGGWVVYPPLNATPEDMMQNSLASFLNVYKDLLIYIVAWWGIIAVTTTAKTIMIIRR
jgi:hypothetical protein